MVRSIHVSKAALIITLLHQRRAIPVSKPDDGAFSFQNSLKEFVDKKILIFDDLVMSGDSLSCVRNQILSFGFDNAKTETAALVCTTMAREARKAPDFSWYKTSTNRFYFPWGQAR